MVERYSELVKGIFVGAIAIALLWLASSMVGSPDDSLAVDAPATASASSQDRSSDPQAAPTPDKASDSVADEFTQFSELPATYAGDLPPEALDTLDLISSGGPYPYSKDDSTFQNREGILPNHERGYYREYTVDTPGSSDRGARRIVAGADGDLYYTDDHYNSFVEIVS